MVFNPKRLKKGYPWAEAGQEIGLPGL